MSSSAPPTQAPTITAPPASARLRSGPHTAAAQSIAAPPAGVHAGDAGEARSLRRRRFAMAALVGITISGLIAAMALVLLPGGLNLVELAMLVAFALTLPWLSLGLWNALIGFWLLRGGGWEARVLPLQPAREGALAARLAIVVPVHDEDTEAVLHALRTTLASLDAAAGTPPRLHYEVFLLSDTRDLQTVRRERELFARWRRSDARPERLHYRRRADNAGFKAGNIADFCRRWGGRYDQMLVLDADSLMTGDAILRLVGLMEGNPRLGILQTLVVGLPAASPFARIFQFGMRHGMRAYTAGSAWWQGDAGPYWGHNALIRLAPFIAHCRLPEVPGGPPLGGVALSHDQLEAVLMRRAGWQVRVLPVEDGSFEANPPTLLDFIKRDLRWCHGNMQYTRLLRLPRRHRLGRVQMLLAILMYTGSPCWIAFCLLGMLQLLAGPAGLAIPLLVAEPGALPAAAGAAGLGIALIAGVVTMSWAPKLLGLAQVLGDPTERRRYGGAPRVLLGGAVEILFSTLLAPVVSTAQSIFIAGLLLRRRLGWQAQARAARQVTIGEAARVLWPQTLLGCSVAVVLAATAPAALPWAAPLILALLLAVPFAVLTAHPALGRRLAAWRICATPEELAPEWEVRTACRWLDRRRSLRHPAPRTAGGLLPEAAD